MQCEYLKRFSKSKQSRMNRFPKEYKRVRGRARPRKLLQLMNFTMVRSSKCKKLDVAYEQDGKQAVYKTIKGMGLYNKQHCAHHI